MKPKLIILNGPCGIGKSTLAKRYGEDHPLTLQLDIDDVWSMFSHWRERKDESGPLSKKLALEMAKVALADGHDVVVPQIIQSAELAADFKRIAESCDSEYVEVLLSVAKDEAIRRFVERGKAQGYPTGFRPGGLLETSGGETKLADMYDNMTQAIGNRQDIIVIEPVLGDIESTYAAILKSLE